MGSQPDAERSESGCEQLRYVVAEAMNRNPINHLATSPSSVTCTNLSLGIEGVRHVSRNAVAPSAQTGCCWRRLRTRPEATVEK